MTRGSALVPCLGLAATLAAGAAHGADDPKTVYHQYTAALAAGDVDAAKNLAVADAQRMPLLDGRRDAADAERQFRAAIEKAFPGELKPVDYPGPTTWPSEAAGAERVTVLNDTATYVTREGPDPIKFQRTAGGWKVDLNAMYPAKTVAEISTFRAALVEVMNALAAEVTAGRFKTYQDVQAELETRVKMRIANPDQATTQSTTRATSRPQ